MGLETATYVSGLTPSWPLAGDLKSQGDDHIRLLKATLQASFPTANKPFYFPTAEAITSTLTLDATDQNNTVIVDTTGGNVAVTLPGSLTSTDKGWQCQVVKTSADTNAAIVSPASGNIVAKAGTVATVRVGVYCEPATFFWTGSGWLCYKPGPNIGSVEDYNGGSVPYGYLATDGSSFSSTSFAELFAALASSTLPDMRGRVGIGDGTGSGLTARVKGTTYGAETMQLAVTNLPAETPAGSISGGSTRFSFDFGESQTGSGAQRVAAISGNDSRTQDITNEIAANPTFNGTSFPGRNATAFGLLQPSIGVKKIIRAC